MANEGGTGQHNKVAISNLLTALHQVNCNVPALHSTRRNKRAKGSKQLACARRQQKSRSLRPKTGPIFPSYKRPHFSARAKREALAWLFFLSPTLL